MAKRKYKRLHYEDRQTIEAMSKQGSSVSDIAEVLGTHRDTIYREFKRCNATLKTYTAAAGQGDLVQVPRTQFAPMRSGWNGWLFSEAVVIRKGVGRKSKRNVVVVEMRTPAGKNSYGTIEATFYAENVFTTPAAKNARNILKKYGIEDAESFYKFIERDDVTGCDWIRFLIEKGFLFNE